MLSHLRTLVVLKDGRTRTLIYQNLCARKKRSRQSIRQGYPKRQVDCGAGLLPFHRLTSRPSGWPPSVCINIKVTCYFQSQALKKAKIHSYALKPLDMSHEPKLATE